MPEITFILGYFQSKIETFIFQSSVRYKYGHEGLIVHVYLITNGDTDDLKDLKGAKEYNEEKKKLLAKYSNRFREFNYHEIGAIELTEFIEQIHRSRRKVDIEFEIEYDKNRPSLIEYNTKDSKAVVCTIKGSDLAKVASIEPKDAIFDLNVRPYYGSKGKVNSQIYAACTDDVDSAYFWFLNNGITMVCDEVRVTPDPEKTLVRVKNAQIVNGCQTSVSIREAAEKKKLRDTVRVLLRIYETSRSDLAKKITLTTNNQNKITDRDLRANDSVQQLIQTDMKNRFNYLYERKNKEYRNLNKAERIRIISNEKAGQAYLAIVKRKPSQARGFLAKIWSTYYQDIFENSVVEDLLLSYLIYSFFLQKSKEIKSDSILDNTSILLVYGTFHLARIAGFLMTGDKWGAQNRIVVQNYIRQIDAKGSQVLKQYYDDALNRLTKVWNKALIKDQKLNPTLFFKAGKAEATIEESLGYSEEIDIAT
jgi:hypothetical protein